MHELPARLDPITVTTVRPGPEDGESTSVPTPVVAVVVAGPEFITKASEPVTVMALFVPVIRTVTVAAGAVLETTMERTVGVLPPAGGVMGLVLKAPATPVGNPVAESVTGALNAPWD